MIHQQLPPKPLLFPHIEATSVCFLEHPLLVPCYSAGEKMCGNIAENHGPTPGRSPIPRMRGTAERQALPPAFMRGEGHAVAGGVPPPQRRGRPSQSRFACQLSQRESQGCCAPFLPPAFMRGEGHAVAGGVLRRSGGDGPLSHASRASSPGGEAKGAAPRSPVIPGRLLNRRENLPDEGCGVSLCTANPAGKNSFSAIENTCFLPAAVI